MPCSVRRKTPPAHDKGERQIAGSGTGRYCHQPVKVTHLKHTKEGVDMEQAQESKQDILQEYLCVFFGLCCPAIGCYILCSILLEFFSGYHREHTTITGTSSGTGRSVVALGSR